MDVVTETSVIEIHSLKISNKTHARNSSGTELRRSLLNQCRLVSLKAVVTAKELACSLYSVTTPWSARGSTLVGFPTLLLKVGVLHRSYTNIHAIKVNVSHALMHEHLKLDIDMSS